MVQDKLCHKKVSKQIQMKLFNRVSECYIVKGGGKVNVGSKRRVNMKVTDG